MQLAPSLGVCLIAVAMMGRGSAQPPPANVDPHEDPAAQDSDRGKKSSGQAADAPPSRLANPPAQAITKTAPALEIVAPAKPVEPDEAILGDWSLVIEKSKFNPGPPPRSEVRSYVKTPAGIVATVTTTQPNGRKDIISYRWQPDGKEYAVTGSELLDTIRLERIDNLTAEASLRHGDKVIARERRTLAVDGKTMTIVVKDVSSDDRPIDVTAVYEKQSPQKR